MPGPRHLPRGQCSRSQGTTLLRESFLCPRDPCLPSLGLLRAWTQDQASQCQLLSSSGLCRYQCLSLLSRRKPGTGGTDGSGAGCRGIPPTLQSGQAATSVLPVNSNSDPESSNFSGGKSLGLFLSCSSWKGTNWHRSHVHTPSYTTYDTKRGANTRQASGALWVTHGGQVS